MKNFGVEYLHSLSPLGMTGDLKNMDRMLEALGHPEKRFRTIHVVGTDGKGSTAFYLSNILAAHGILTGLYTSPHLVNVRERIRINGNPVGEEDFDRLLEKVRDVSAERGVRISFFEAMTLACFLHFAEKNVDCAVVEAGLGGRLDSTRAACGELAVLTSIGLEHTELLGQTEQDILREKLGILSPHAKIFIGNLSTGLLRLADEFVRKIPAETVHSRTLEDLEVPNSGHHYIENASLSFACAREFLKDRFDETLARDAIKSSPWTGRMQKLVGGDGKFRWLLDGAHNPHAMKRLAEALAADYPGKKFHCVFGALKDKNIREMIFLLKPFVKTWHVTRTPYSRFRDVENVASELEFLGCKVGSSAPLSREFLNAVEKESGGEPVLVTGSLYMIGLAIYLLKDEFESLKFFRGMQMSESETH